MQKFVVVSFAIAGHGTVDRLKESLERFDIKHDLVICDDRAARRFKYSQAVFIKEMLKKHAPLPVIWFDHDLILTRYPNQFDVQSTILALYSHDITTALDTSIIYLSNEPGAHKIMDMWIDANAEYPDRFESENLRAALFIWHKRYSGQLGRIPDTYSPSCIVEDKVAHRRSVQVG